MTDHPDQTGNDDEAFRLGRGGVEITERRNAPRLDPDRDPARGSLEGLLDHVGNRRDVRISGKAVPDDHGVGGSARRWKEKSR